MLVTNAFSKFLRWNDVTGFYKIRREYIFNEGEMFEDLDWLAIQAQQHETGLIDMTEDVLSIMRKYGNNQTFWEI